MMTGVEDMIQLPQLTEDSLMENLRERYEVNKIYTYTGTILVSVNPYQLLDIYTMDIVRRYVGQRIGALPPHIFAIADDSFRNMADGDKNQSVIISGESGAGKTEATKLILQFLSARTTKHSDVERKILESSPILEAFGNAKTVRNNNSSRFGKYMQVSFDSQNDICGAEIIQYLLEKSRIVGQAESERNYHIFYQLCKAPGERKESLELGSADDFYYLNQSGCIEIEGVEDGEDFERVMSAMTTLGISQGEQDEILRMLAAVLHIGNITYQVKAGAKGGEASQVATPDVIERVSKLLCIPGDLLAKSLCERINIIRAEKFVVPLKIDEAEANRDAFSKTIYADLFSWLVKRINSCLAEGATKIKPKAFIGVLDIFGFENFKVNSFEQFCINFCNEKLQQHFNQHIFKLEQEEYKKEAINIETIKFVDNQECIDLVERRSPGGIIALLDEECRFPKGTDYTLLEKLHQNFAKHQNYDAPKISKSTFVVRHYAGDVSYEIGGFLDKNKDNLQDELIDLLLQSESNFISNIFADSRGYEDSPAASKKSAPPTKNAQAQGTIKRKTGNTVSVKFRDQLNTLVTTLSATQPHYVRCIKPNKDKSPSNWDPELVMAQLRYAGMMETIRIRKLGYPVRFGFKEFFLRFRCLKVVPSNVSDPKQRCKVILDGIPNVSKEHWQIGVSKVFLKDNLKSDLEDMRKLALTQKAIIIQKKYRMHMARKRFKKIKKASVTLQAASRRLLCRFVFKKKRAAIVLIQSTYKMYKKRKAYQQTRSKVIKAQKYVRSYLAKKTYKALIKEKQEREERERLERERILAERAQMDAIAREQAEREEREKEEADKLARDEENKQRSEEEKEKIQRLKEEAERKREEAERQAEMQHLEKLGVLSDITAIGGQLNSDEAPMFALPPPPPPMGSQLPPDISNVDDDDLLDRMANPDFFGEIPSAVGNLLSELAGNEAKQNDFGFLEAPPPPPNSLGAPPTALSGPGLPPPKASAHSSRTVITSLVDPPEIVTVDEIGNYVWKTFASINCREISKKIKRGEVYAWTKKPIQRSLLERLPDESGKIADQIFLRVLNYMGDKKGAEPMAAIRYILEKAHTYEELRDEIYCQICKQLTDNPNKYSLESSSFNFQRESRTKGWELMAVCCCMFSPTNFFVNYLASFLITEAAEHSNSLGDKEWAAFCVRSLRRTVQNGNRRMTPSDAEIQSILQRKFNMIRIRLMNGMEKAFFIDSATTCEEAFEALVERIELKDPTGFAMYAVYHNIARKLELKDTLADAIAKSESLQKTVRDKNVKLSFAFVFKKSLFLEIKPTFPDPVELDLILNQALYDVIEGNLPVTTEVGIELGSLKMQMDFGDFDPVRVVHELVKRYVPKLIQNLYTADEWRNVLYVGHASKKGKKKEELQHDIMNIVQKLPLYGASLFNGLQLSERNDKLNWLPSRFDMGVNSHGLHFLEPLNKAIIRTVPFIEALAVAVHNTRVFGLETSSYGVLLIETEGEAPRLHQVLSDYAQAMINTSKYAKALQDYTVSDPQLLSFKKGDIILLKEKVDGWYVGELRGATGFVPMDMILPMVQPPSAAELAENEKRIRAATMRGNNLGTMRSESSSGSASSTDTMKSESSDSSSGTMRGKPELREHNTNQSLSTLRQKRLSGGASPINPDGKEEEHKDEGEGEDHGTTGTMRGIPSPITTDSLSLLNLRITKRGTFRRQVVDVKHVMNFTRDPIKDSLLATSPTKESKDTFVNVMKYMGDYPSKGSKKYKIAQEIIQLGVENAGMRDEILCQICKQTTGHPKRESVVRGWYLMNFCLGVFAPTNDFVAFLTKFLDEASVKPGDNQINDLAKNSINLFKEISAKGNRRRAPSKEEMKAIKENRTVVCKIYLLDGTAKAVYANSLTTVNEAAEDMNGKLNIAPSYGFSIFQVNHIEDSIMPLPGNDAILDYLSIWEKHLEKEKGKDIDSCFKFLFKRRIMINPPEDDLKLANTEPVVFSFVFQQILHDFRTGKLPYNEKDSSNLVALQLQIRYGGESVKHIDKNNVQLGLPRNMKDNFVNDDFIESVRVNTFELKGIEATEAKGLFLQRLVGLPLYGAIVYTVQMRGKKVWLALTRKAIQIWEPFGKEPKQSWSYEEVNGWASSSQFNLETGNIMRPETHVFTGSETDFVKDLFELYKGNSSGTFKRKKGIL